MTLDKLAAVATIIGGLAAVLAIIGAFFAGGRYIMQRPQVQEAKKALLDILDKHKRIILPIMASVIVLIIAVLAIASLHRPSPGSQAKQAPTSVVTRTPARPHKKATATPTPTHPPIAWRPTATNPPKPNPTATPTATIPVFPTPIPTPTPTPTPTPVPTPSKSIQIGWSSRYSSYIWMTLNQFPTGTYTYTCTFSTGGDASFQLNETTEPETWDDGRTCYDQQHGDRMWVVINGVASNQLTVP